MPHKKGISVYSLPWVLSEGCSVLGLIVFCYGFVQASCKYIKGYFTCCLCKRKLLGIIRVGFDEMGQLLIIYFEFVRYLKKTKGLQ